MYCKKCGTPHREDVKFCKKCGNSMTIRTTGSTASSVDESEPKAKPASQAGILVKVFGKMLGNALGKLLAYIIIYIIALGIVALSIEIPFLAPITLIFAVFYGWRFIDFLTPAMFVWMPLMGWVIYFVVKFFVAAILGVFIVPYQLARRFIGMCTEYPDDYEEE